MPVSSFRRSAAFSTIARRTSVPTEQNLGTSSYREWTIGIQREIFKNVSFEARYVGNRGRDLRRIADFNEININARDSVTGADVPQCISDRPTEPCLQQCEHCHGESGPVRHVGSAMQRCQSIDGCSYRRRSGASARPADVTRRAAVERAGEFAFRLVHSETSFPGTGQTERIRGGSFWGGVLATTPG